LLIHPPGGLWTKAGRAWLETVELPATERLVLDSELRQLATVENELVIFDRELQVRAQKEPRVRLLMTLPGVDYVVALGLLAALGDIHRFRDGAHAASYLGLAPSTRQSGNRCYHGHITKAGNSLARSLLTQGCQHIARHPGPLGGFFRRLAQRKNRQVAIMTVARKLVTIAFLMLKHNEPYRYGKPKLVANKLSLLDRAAKSPAKASPRKTSLRAQARVGLAAVYAQAGLPSVVPPDQLPGGERRMLTERKLDDFVNELDSPAARQLKKPPAKQRSATAVGAKGKRASTRRPLKS
jgi:transposase